MSYSSKYSLEEAKVAHELYSVETKLRVVERMKDFLILKRDSLEKKLKGKYRNGHRIRRLKHAKEEA